MKKVLYVKKIGSEYQIFDPTGFERPMWAETHKECADAIDDYRHRHPGMPVKFENVYKDDEMKIRKMAKI
jgi:hypothetical protein